MPNPQRLQPSGHNSHFTPASSYAELIAQQIKILDPHHPEIYPTEHITDNHKAVVLIHGLYETPYGMRHLANYFTEHYYYTRNILLPGHGSRPGELLETHLSDWLAAVEFAIDTLPSHINHITLVGFSAGAGFALYHTLMGKPIDNLILFAPCIKLKNPFTYFAQYLQMIKNWYLTGPDDDFAKYQSISLHSIAEIYTFTQQLKTLDPAHSARVMTINSKSDEIICPNTAINYPADKKIIYNDLSHCDLITRTNPYFDELIDTIDIFLR